MHKLLPYALFAGLAAILGHVAFLTLEDLGGGNRTLEDMGGGNRFVAWVKIAVVFGTAYFLMSSTRLERRYNSPTWVWATFGAIGTLGTLLVLTQLGKYVMIAIAIVLFPLHLLGLVPLLPYVHFALLALLLKIVNDLRRDEVDA